MEKRKETYLGDGLYGSYDGVHYILRCERGNGDHWVALEGGVLTQFFRLIEKMQGVTISVTENPDWVDEA